MGVTNRNELQYPKPDQIPNPDSLHIPISSSHTSLASASDIEVLPVRSNSRRRRPKRHNFVGDVSLSPRHHAGRRRLRRHNAVCELKALIEEEEIEEVEAHPYRSPFTVILENPELEMVWYKFTQQDERQQTDTINLLSGNAELRQKIRLSSYSNISQKIRTSFKTLRDFCELARLETEIIEFFTTSPEDVYKKDDKSSFQRLLIHGIAQYYTLKSTSFEGDNGKRTIKVVNPNDIGTVSGKRLCELVQENRKKCS